MLAPQLNREHHADRGASLFETRIRGSQLFFVIVVWTDGAQVRVGIGEIRLRYDGTVVEGRYATHDPVREFASPYSYVGGDPVNATDPNGECGLLCVIIIGFVVGALASGIQAAVNGASPVQALKAAAIGGTIGGAGAFVGATVVAPVIGKVITPFVANQLIAAGMDKVTAALTAKLAVTGSFVGGSLAQAGYGASRGDYTGVIGLGLTVGILSAGTGSLSGFNRTLGGLGDDLDLLLNRGGWAPPPGSQPYNTLTQGIEGVQLPDVRGDLSGMLGRGNIRVYDQAFGSADAVTLGENIFVPTTSLSMRPDTLSYLLGHEYFHVLEFRYGVRSVFVPRSTTQPEYRADIFGAQVTNPIPGSPRYLNSPDLFGEVLAGRLDYLRFSR